MKNSEAINKLEKSKDKLKRIIKKENREKMKSYLMGKEDGITEAILILRETE